MKDLITQQPGPPLSYFDPEKELGLERRPREKILTQLIYSEPMSLPFHEQKQHAVNYSSQEKTQLQDGKGMNINMGPNEDQNNRFTIMTKQNKITNLKKQRYLIFIC